MSNLEKIINLIKKTGDNCIILDQNGEPTYVVLDFDKYQKLISSNPKTANLSDIDKTNQEIASWKAEQEPENLDNWPVPEESEEGKKSLKQAKNTPDLADSKEKYYFEPID